MREHGLPVQRMHWGAVRLPSAFAALLLVAGCVTLPPNAGQDPRDPLEKINRNVFAFNEGFDKAILKPLAELWEKLPDGIRDCFSNAFFNLRGPSTAINNALQGKGNEALSDVGRFVVNTTVGVVGCFDVASKMGMEIHNEDFGQTLGVWGFGPGAYLVVPILGPSSVRDAVGIYGVEPFLDLNFYIDYPAIEYTVLGLRIVNQRAQLLPADRIINEAALDKYSFVRDSYLQRRRSLVYDGNPPREPDDQDDSDGETDKPAEGKSTEDKPTDEKQEQAAPGAATDAKGDTANQPAATDAGGASGGAPNAGEPVKGDGKSGEPGR